jgi:phage-related protein
MPSLGRRCHELRILDDSGAWRIIYRLDADAVVIVDVFSKKSPQTPKNVVASVKQRLQAYDRISGGKDG